ncbi:MAG: Tn3 family transposase [Gammaproteobacteria bacterium]|nr:Tn3 family transposase [Gammaproteobacteria bacterium]
MTSIDRTAYPHLNKKLSEQELALCYEIDDDEKVFIRSQARNHRGYLVLAVLLKTHQQLGYFISLEKAPKQIVSIIAQQLSVPEEAWQIADENFDRSLYRYRAACQKHLKSTTFSNEAWDNIQEPIRNAALTMSDPADLINVAIEKLINEKIDLPAFSTLDRLVGHERETVHNKLYLKVTSTLKPAQCQALDALLEVAQGERITEFARMKQTPGPATLGHFRAWENRLAQLDSILDPKPFFDGIAYTKIRQFAAEASVYALGDIRGVSNDARRYTLLLSLLHETQRKTRDELIDMFLRRMKGVHHAAQNKLHELQEKHRGLEESLIGFLGEIIQRTDTTDSNEVLGEQVRDLFDNQGGIEAMADQFKLVTAYHHNNYLPLLWPVHANNRAVIFRVLDQINIKSSTQDQSLLRALSFVSQHRNSRKKSLPAEIDLGFASQRWQVFVYTKEDEKRMFDRRALEVCVFSHVAEALAGTDLYVEDSGEYADYRRQLLSLTECEKRLPEYCQSLGLPASSDDFVTSLKERLTTLVNKVDEKFPGNGDLSIDDDGVPHLKRQKASPLPEGVDDFKSEVYSRMPERHLLDILKDVQHWANYTKHFGPPSGSDSKIADAASRYLFTVFGYGCNLGASQTARHAPSDINSQNLLRINAQHINISKLEAALSEVINEYSRFELPGFWGKSNVAIADGTQMELRRNTLMGEQHIRYGGFGGIAYHHISSEYIALFSHFISCGVWEAVYILDALLLNKSVYQPDTIHADTHGQSESVFALAHLLGIKLYPRMRTWNDVAFYRPDKKTKYKHINSLFTKTVDWSLIETHWKDMMQVVLSIQAGKVLPSMLLRKLNSNNRKNKLYRAFRELGRVTRTLFLLRYISEADFRQTIRAETTKVESYNDFLDWITFGGQIIKSGDPVEQTKQIKYSDLIANSIMLHNVVALTKVLVTMAKEGYKITKELVSSLSPFIREQIRRFGRYDVDMTTYPPDLESVSVLLN